MRSFGKIAGHFCIVFQMNMARDISRLQEYQARFWAQYTLKNTDPETVSFRINDISSNKQALFDICGLMQYQKSSYQSV